MDRLTHVEQLLRNDPRDPVLAADYFVFQTLGQRPRDFIAQRGHEMNPVRTQARGEDGNHNDSAARKSEFFRHDAHDVAVAERLTPADVKNTTDRFRRRQDASQVREHILDGDGLATGGDPLWSDHDRQAVNEIAKNLERCRARTNDHSRAQDRDRHSCRPERRLDVPARREMFTKAGACLSKTTEIYAPAPWAETNS